MSENGSEVKKQVITGSGGLLRAGLNSDVLKDGNFIAATQEIIEWQHSPSPRSSVGSYFVSGRCVIKLSSMKNGKVMTMYKKQFLGFVWLFLLTAMASRAQAPDPAAPSQDQAGPPAEGLRGGPKDNRGPGLFGKIAAISNGVIELTKPDGSTATVRITDKTEYRKDRQAAKLGDFKVGDIVFMRVDENADHSMTAQLVGARTGAGPGGAGRGPGGGFGELGKDFIFGEVKSVDAPKLTVLRPDNVTQTLELNEETSLRRGRESITMADIQPGEHIMVQGSVEKNAFVPKNVVVFSPEQWKQMEEMRKMSGMGPAGTAPAGSKPAAAPKSNPPER